MSFIIFDTEFIADKGLFEVGFNGWKNREIIQLAAVKVDNDLNIIDKFNVYVKPYLHKEIPLYFINVTGITNEKISQCAISFPEAYKQFKNFAKDEICYSHNWDFSTINDGDGQVFRECLRAHNLKEDEPLNYQNIAPWFKKKYTENNININKQASGDIARLLGRDNNILNLRLDAHNALYDVYSILEGIRYFNTIPTMD